MNDETLLEIVRLTGILVVTIISIIVSVVVF